MSTFCIAEIDQRVLSDGTAASIPYGQHYIEVSQPQVAGSMVIVRNLLIDMIRIFSVLYVLRFNVQFFGLNPYNGGVLEILYKSTEGYARAFIGVFPVIYGIDCGLLVGFYLLDKIETMLGTLAITVAT